MERNNETSALPPLVFRKYKGRRGRKNEWKAGGEDGIPLSLPCWNILAWVEAEKVLRLEKVSDYHEFHQVHNTHRTQELSVMRTTGVLSSSWQKQCTISRGRDSSMEYCETWERNSMDASFCIITCVWGGLFLVMQLSILRKYLCLQVTTTISLVYIARFAGIIFVLWSVF